LLRKKEILIFCCLRCFYSSFNFVSFRLQIVEAAASAFLLCFALLVSFSAFLLLPLLINFDSLSTLQEITHPLDNPKCICNLFAFHFLFFSPPPGPSFGILFRFPLPLHYVLYYCLVSIFFFALLCLHFKLVAWSREATEAASKAVTECPNK